MFLFVKLIIDNSMMVLLIIIQFNWFSDLPLYLTPIVLLSHTDVYLFSDPFC